MNSADDFLSTGEASRIVGVSVYTLRNRIHDGTLPARRLGRLYRIRLRDLEEAFRPAEPLRRKPENSLPPGMAVVHHREGWSGIAHASLPREEDGNVLVTRAGEDRLTQCSVRPEDLKGAGE